MDICLDTNVFRDTDRKRFFLWIREKGIKAYIPAIAYMDLSYHEIKKFGSTAKMDAFFSAEGITPVPFTPGQAVIASTNARKRNDFRENARDYAIGAFAYENGYIMVTNNKKHFDWIKEVYTPAEIMHEYR